MAQLVTQPVTPTAALNHYPDLMGRKKQLLLAIARAVDETGSCRSVTQGRCAES